jgi:antitoxin component HigA of HigAB toxin-antitoxin module
MMHIETIGKNWEALYQAQLHRIESEKQYLEMLDFMRDLMSQKDTTTEPYLGLWRLAARYVAEWEAANDDLATEPLEPAAILRGLMDSNGITQNELAVRIGITQSHLSRILSGERKVTAKLVRSIERVFRAKLARDS